LKKIDGESPEGPQGKPAPDQKLNPEQEAWHKANVANNLLREMGLFGNTTPKGDDPIWFPIKIMGEAQALIHTKKIRKDYERDLGERLTPYKDMLRHVEMAYEIIAYPQILHRESNRPEATLSPHPKYTDLAAYYGVETKEKIADGKAHPGEDVQENPHQGTITLNRAERDLLVMLTYPRGLPCDPEKVTYRYADLAEAETEDPRAKWQREMKDYLKGYQHLRRFRKPTKNGR
jgi:hypothetical protein